MAVRSPAHDPSWSPDRESSRAPADEAGATDGEAPRSNAAADVGALDLGLMRAVIEDGLLMVFGPDGDPVPPQIFAAAAAQQPHAQVPLADGRRVVAERIAAVLQAQVGGRLGSAQGGDEPWICAMLGIGPQPEQAADGDLAAEEHAIEVVAFGRELMITSPAGATFLITEARSTTPGGIRLRAPAGQPVALGELVARLVGGADRPGGHLRRAKANEVTFPGCRTRLEDDALIVDLPGVGAVRFVGHDLAAGQGTAVSVFKPDGDTATIDELLAALSQRLTCPRTEAARRQEAGPAMGVHYDDDPGPTPVSELPPASSPGVPLAIHLSDALGPQAEGVALVSIRGLPHGASLSAGVASGDGSWLLSPRDLAELYLAPPPGWTPDLALEVTAITVEDRDGQLTSASRTLLVSPRSVAVARSPAPIPIVLDPQLLRGQDGRFDAVIVRDLPANATLSAGTYDPAIDGWVLLPRQLPGLTFTPPVAQAEDFTLTILGISLAGKERPRLLAEIPVRRR